MLPLMEANSLKKCTMDMHDEIRELTGKRKLCPQGRGIRSVDGSVLTISKRVSD